MRAYQGDFPINGTVYFYFDSFDGATGASEAISGLAVEDIKIFKNGSVTERASTSGFTLLDADGIDFDGITGINGFKIDLSDNTDAGFYAAGNEYVVIVASITADGQTVNFVAGSFSIERSGGALALLKNATYGLSALETLVNDLESRLTAARAGYLDNLSAGAVALASGVIVTTNNDKTGYALSASAIDAILDDAPSAELSAVPSTTGTLRQMIQFIFSYFRNKKTITLTTETLFKEDASTSLGTATVSDDGITMTKGEMN